MKKRILSILLCLCMAACMLPTAAFAADTGKAIQLGTNALNENVNTAAAPTVYFGQNQENNPGAWRVIGYDGNGVAGAQEDMTLLAAGSMGEAVFDNDCLSNEYAPSDLKTAIDALAGKLTTKENAAVKKRTLTSGSHNGENTDCVAGGQVDNAVFWPLSSKEAIAVNEDLRVVDPEHPTWATSNWWLRSPGSQAYYVAVVNPDGSVHYSGYTIRIYRTRGVRPAFNLNLNSVLFASAAVDGKPDGELTPISEYTGNEWKLTLLDNSRNFAVTETTASGDPGDTLTLHYNGATTGTNEYISVILADNSGAKYYGRVAQPAEESGTVEIKIPSDIAPGSYTLKVFSEQCNGDKKTDYASDFTDIALTVEKQADEQFTLAPGGTYYFDLSDENIPGTANDSLPDSTLHYVPFTYAGAVDAYSLKNEVDTDTTSYKHSLFVADYAVTHTVSWDNLNTADLIFGKGYAAGGVNYTLRAPSVGSDRTGLNESQRGTPQINEWDKLLDKNDGYIKNWKRMASWGQDTRPDNSTPFRAVRGFHSARGWEFNSSSYQNGILGFRPVLEVLNPDTLGSDGLKVVTLDLNGGKLGGSSDAIQIIVKKGESFTAPSAEGLPRPDGISEDAQLYWSDENGNCYKPGDTVPADVSMLSITGDYEVIYLPGTYGTGSAVTDMKPHNNILTLRGALFTRAGYTQVGWSTVDGGEKVYGFEDIYTKNEALTLYPVWNTNKYTITFDTNGGSEIAPITQDYGTEITAPDNPTRKGYTFKGWDKEIPRTMPVENITVKAQWEINQYTITFDTNGGSEIAPITQDYGTEITAPDNPTRKGYTFKGWDKEIPKAMPAENITITARWKDTEKPTGEIIIGTNKWNQFLNELTFGIFFKDTQEVTINAVDNSGVVFVSYLVTDKELSEAELNSLVFRAYEEPFCIDPNGEYIVYVMLVDENINITYLRSDRITLDNIQPVISGIENGKTYCEAQTVTVDEKYVDTVTVNGTAVTLDADGGFVLPPTNGEQKIVVTDKAGNNAEMTVTVNNGHTFGEWVSDNNGKHTRKCTVDGCDAFETENCSGGNATCTEKAVCDVCGKAYGEFDGTNHEGGVQEWTTRTAFNHEQKWNCCGAVIVASEAHEWKDGVCRECGYVCLHNDADKDHICDYCKKTISEHVDKDKNHICDYCEKTISAREDAPTEEIKKANTVTAKLPDDSKSPQTGDNSNLILWIALLIISGGVMKGVTAFGKSKKHSAKIKDK